MSIIRVRKDARYFTASNEPFVDKRMSWETRGLMGYLLTKPDNWQVRIEDLIAQGPAGLHKLRRMLSEARLYGYMNRIRYTNEDGTFGWITEVFESPSQNPNPSTSIRKSTSGLSTSGKPADIVITDLTSTEEKKTATTTTAAPKKSNFAKLYEENIGPLTPLIGDELKDLATDYSEVWLERAIAEAASSNVRNLKYIRGVLAGYRERGSPDIGRTKVKERKATVIPQAQNTDDIIKRMAADAYNRR